jgi:thiosulfate/3-mercaptopyruvate sulfurtransferase
MRKAAILIGMAISAAAAFGATCGGHGTRASMLVTPKWLADHRNDPNLVVFGVGQKSDFDAAHIPGSVHLDIGSIVIRNGFELPPIADLATTFGNLGVSNDSHIVLYMTKDGAFSLTTRAYLTLDAMGLGAQTSLLDGGLGQWQHEGQPVTAEVREPKPVKLQPCAQSDVIVDVNFVKSNLSKAGIDLVDARMKNFYTGETPGRNMRPGRIPGALNLPYTNLVDQSTGKFLAADAMEKLFQDSGVKKGDRVVTYCHIGQTATVVYFAARYLGYDTRLYDGSFEEWSRLSELPVEK